VRGAERKTAWNVSVGRRETGVFNDLDGTRVLIARILPEVLGFFADAPFESGWQCKL
jgi:hypothetical protein